MLPFQLPQTRFDLRFRLLGVAARVDPTFWLGALIFARPNTPFLFIVTGVALLFVSILVHEMGHALCGKHYGDRRPGIVLYGMGGLYLAGDVELHRGRQVWMLLCGPLAGFVLGAIAVGFYFAGRRGLIPDTAMAEFLITNGILINVLWGLVNLLPIFPLDGGQILREVMRWKYHHTMDTFTYTVSIVTAIIAALGTTATAFLYDTGFFPIALFTILAYQNYRFRKFELLTGGFSEEQAPRQPWEQDADWWKSGEEQDSDWWKKG